MKTKLFIIFLFIIICTGCSTKEIETSEKLLFNGDILLQGDISEFLDQIEFHNLEYNDEKVKAAKLLDIINVLEPSSENYNVYFIAHDGFTIKINSETLNDTYIALSKKNGWCFVSEHHPVNSKIKNIKECIIVSDNKNLNLNIIANDENNIISYGELKLASNENILLSDGISSLDGTTIEVMKNKLVARVDNLVDEKIEKLLLITEDGKSIYDYNEVGYVELSNGKVNYITKDLKNSYLNIKGIIINPSPNSIKDHYDDVIHYLDKGEKVLTIFIDGFSYNQYVYMMENNIDLYINTLGKAKKAIAAFKPVTNVGFATMITGQDPSNHGVHDRSYRQVQVNTIFDYCEENGLRHRLIEGDINILELNTETDLNFDENNNGITDDEIFSKSQEVISSDLDYLMIHFHSVDEFGHDYGPLDEKTIEEIKKIDKYVEQLVNKWDGKVMIIADHGMHKTDDGGDHGEFLQEDLMVPYIIGDGAYEKYYEK